MITSFKSYLLEEEKTVFFTWGRLNPPTIGHGLLLDTLAKKAGRNPYKVYLTQSNDKKKNPLTYKDKVKFARKMFPKHSRSIVYDTKMKTVFDVAVALYNEGNKNITMVVGSDRVKQFKDLLDKYNGEKKAHGFYDFNRITVISAGARDPDADDLSGASASKQRASAAANDFTTFAQGTPKNVSNAECKALFNAVRSGMGLKETREFKRFLDLGNTCELREKYIAGRLFNVGDKVIVNESEESGEISFLGSNYIILETSSGQKIRKWIKDISPETEYDI